MKTTLIILMGFFLLGNAKAQIIPVTDLNLETQAQTQTGIQASMNSTMNSMEKIQKALDKIAKSAKYIKSLESANRLLQLINSTICTYQNLNYLMSLNASGRFCNFSFNYEIAMLQLKAAIDVVGLVVKDGVNMEQAGRSSNFTQAIALFREANMSLAKLTNSLEAYNFNVNMQKQMYKDSRQINQISRYSTGPRRR